jgi:hypothetical protein
MNNLEIGGYLTICERILTVQSKKALCSRVLFRVLKLNTSSLVQLIHKAIKRMHKFIFDFFY